jgi:hypothetical protein
MAALTANKARRQRNIHAKRFGKGTGADSSEFYEGGIVASNNAGRLARAANTANFKAAGVNPTRKTTGASNTQLVEFEYGHEEWFAHDGNLAVTSLFKNASVLDDGTLSNAATATLGCLLGMITELETIEGVAGAWVAVGVFAPTNA